MRHDLYYSCSASVLAWWSSLGRLLYRIGRICLTGCMRSEGYEGGGDCYFPLRPTICIALSMHLKIHTTFINEGSSCLFV